MSELQKMLDKCYEYCQDIEKAGIVKVKMKTSLKENLKYEFLKFLAYLSTADGCVEDKEIEFIKTSIGFEITPGSISLLRNPQYESQVPMVFKYFVLTDAGHKLGASQNNRAKTLADTYAAIGQEFLALGDDNGEQEIAKLTKYTRMLDGYMREFGLYVSDRRFIKTTQEIKTEKEEAPVSVEEILQELNSLIGLKSVKEDVETIINLLKIQKIRKEHGMKEPNVSKHLVFSGNPGTGKTTVARLLAKVYAALEILDGGQLIEVDRSGLVSGYVGQTAMKTADVIEKAKGGVLFIDEAYTLTANRGENDFGQEAVDTLLKGMEDNRDNLIVIVAGYPALMEEFLDSNPGLRSRFNKRIYFEDYTPQEEVEILNSIAKSQEYVLSQEAQEEALRFFADRIEKLPSSYANARDARNYLEKAISNQAGRIVNLENIDKEVLALIEKEDLPEEI